MRTFSAMAVDGRVPETTMVDLKQSWMRFRDLPDNVLDDLPDHVRSTFVSARRHGFEVEMLCAGIKIPVHRRAPRRIVLVADDLGPPLQGGPLHFDLAGLAEDARAARRLFVLSSASRQDIFAAAYAAAVEDLTRGYDIALLVETRPQFSRAWARTLEALQKGHSVGRTEVSELRRAPSRRSAAPARRSRMA